MKEPIDPPSLKNAFGLFGNTSDWRWWEYVLGWIVFLAIMAPVVMLAGWIRSL